MVKTKKLSEVVLAARVERTWTQTECAAEAGVSSQLISNIERGEVETLMPLTASKLEHALGLDLEAYTKK